MGRDHFEDDYPRRRRDRDYDDMTRQRSGAVTAMGIISLVVGGIVLLFGICIFIGVALFTGQAGGAGAFNVPMFGEVMGIAIGICLGIILWGVGAVVAGIGILNRSQWGRGLTFVLGALAALVALLFIWGGVHALTEQAQVGGPQPVASALFSFLIGMILLGYTILGYVILLNPVYGAEFN